MFSNKRFLIAVIISLLVHYFVFVQRINFNVDFLRPEKRRSKATELKYVDKTPGKRELNKNITPKREPFFKLPIKVTEDKRTPPPYMEGKSGPPDRLLSKPILGESDIAGLKKKIDLPSTDIDLSKINNPSYISYYQLVREKVRRASYQNYTRTETGEIYLSFVVSRDGSLKDVRLVAERSSQERYLEEIALRSIRDASPFPPFPKELDYPQLSFNVIISFEIE
jgi:TonB family protein